MTPKGQADAATAVAILAALEIRVTAGQVYVWAHRGKVRKVGREKGRTLYAFADIWALAVGSVGASEHGV